MYAQNVHDLYAQAGSVLISNVVIASLLLGLYWGVIPSVILLSWWMAILVLTSVRVWGVRSYRTSSPRPADVPRWARLCIVGSALSGALWGIAGWLFFTNDPQDQMVITFVLAGMAAGATTTLPSLLPAFWYYLVPALAPLTLKLAISGDTRLMVMSVMATAFTVLLAWIGRTMHASLSQAHRLRFKNELLAEQLRGTQARLRDANEYLEARVASRTEELERSQRARAETERELRHAQRLEALGQLTRGVAHDFNNILTIVVGSVELIRIEHQNDHQIQELTEHALAATARAARLTRSLLAFSRTQQLRPERVVVNDLVRRIVDELLGRALGQQIRIETRLDPELWPIRVDPVQLETALINLAINSRDAMHDGGTLTFETRNVRGMGAGGGELSDRRPESICISVSDTGTGIADDIADRVFEPFFTTKQIGQGSGLGLSMVYGFVKQSGGRIQLISRPGSGCTFCLYFPVETRMREQQDRPGAGIDTKQLMGQGELVLVVEDEERVRDLTRRMLGTLGYETVLASHPEEALALLHQEPRIQVLLSDVVMPGRIDGVKLAQLARELRRDLKVVLMSGYSDTDLRDGPAASWHMLHKPYTSEALGRTLRAALHGDDAAIPHGS